MDRSSRYRLLLPFDTTAAACKGLTNLFYADEDDDGSYEYVRQAKAVCATCPCFLACREYAILANEPHGVWGGTTPRERRRIRARMRAENPDALPQIVKVREDEA